MSRFIFRLLKIIIGVYIVMVIFNYLTDFDFIARQGLLKKSIVENKQMIGNNTLRYYKYLMAEYKNIDSNTIILIGSSRALPIGKNINSHKVLNLSVTGMHLYDLKILVDKLNEVVIDKKSKKIVLSIDPWIFNSNNPESRWKFEYERDVVSNFFRFISPKYFRKNLDLKIFYSKKKDLIDTIEFDGSRKYLQDHDCNISDKLTATYIQNNVFENDEFQKIIIDEKYLSDFNKIVSSCLNYKNVVIWLQPIHPNFINCVKAKKVKDSIKKSENFIFDIAKKNKIKVYGSFFQKISTCAFEDHKHLRRDSLSLEFDKLFLNNLN